LLLAGGDSLSAAEAHNAYLNNAEDYKKSEKSVKKTIHG
jgi:hypothetical protein